MSLYDKKIPACLEDHGDNKYREKNVKEFIEKLKGLKYVTINGYKYISYGNLMKTIKEEAGKEITEEK